jgi:CRP-like cAMP-binding protein
VPNGAILPLTNVRNRLLAALPAAVLDDLLPRFTSIVMENGLGFYRSDAPIEAVYFPQNGMISMVTLLEEGVQAEVGVIGPEGMLGVQIVSGVDTSFVDAMVQMPGSALRMDATEFRRELEANAPLRALLLRYNEALKAQIIQTAACNGRHNLEERLARWLLMAHDRIEGDELPLTQEFIALMLGVHRPSITVTAGILQRAGLIRYSKGLIGVLDRKALEAASCECYGAVRKRFSALLGIHVS